MVRLVRGQHPGRLVQDQDVGMAEQRLEDFDALLMADRQILDQRVRLHVQFVFARQIGQHLAGAGQRRAQQRALLGAQHDILQHREILHQLEMLEHHADARADRGLAVGDVHGLAADDDLARIGAVEAVEDRHQRRFSRAVLADDPVDRARHDADRDVLVGLDRPEGLRYPAQLDGRCRGGGGGIGMPPRQTREGHLRPCPSGASQNVSAGQVSSDI